MKYYGFFSARLGSDNQTCGIISQAQNNKNTFIQNPLLKSPDGHPLNRSRYDNGQMFEKDVFDCLENCLKNGIKPDIFILPFNHGNIPVAINDAEALAKTVKRFYFQNNLGFVTTLLLTAAFHNYQHLDLVNIPYHLMNESQARYLKINTKLQKKIIFTLGVAGNLTKWKLQQERNSLKFAKELARYENGKPLALFSLGGRVEGEEIQFSVNDAGNILKKALEFQKKGFNVAFTNSPRTPTDVTDFLFENAQKNDIPFYNVKKIATTKTDDFRLYSGRFKKTFKEQYEKTGNIYPALLARAHIVIGTKDSFSYTSDSAALGIKTAVYADMFIDEKKRPDCNKLFHSLKNKYVFDLNDPRIFDVKTTLPVLPDANKKIISAVEQFVKNKTDPCHQKLEI